MDDKNKSLKQIIANVTLRKLGWSEN